MRIYAVAVDGELLSLQPVLCIEHGDRFLLRASALFATLNQPASEVFKNWGAGASASRPT